MNWLEWIWTIISVWAVGIAVNNYILRYTARIRYEESLKRKAGIQHSFESWLTVDGFTFVSSFSWVAIIIVGLGVLFSWGQDSVVTIMNGIRHARSRRMSLEKAPPLTPIPAAAARRHVQKRTTKLAFTPVRRKRTTSK